MDVGQRDFGYAWDRELTDDDGPYIELMAGFYTDNQPDFSWLQPYETKTLSQFWYPIQEIGPVKNANRRVAVNLERTEGGYRIGVAVTENFGEITVRLSCGADTVFEQRTDRASRSSVCGTWRRLSGNTGKPISGSVFRTTSARNSSPGGPSKRRSCGPTRTSE